MRGVVIIACGNALYGKYAVNLALSIRQQDSEMHITLLKDADGISHIEWYMHSFDEVREIPPEMIKDGAFIRSKVCLDLLSPYDETIFIDADVIMLPEKKVSELFDMFKDIDFTMGCRGLNDLNADPRLVWCNVDDMKKAYQTDKVYNLSSEFIYFKKTSRVMEMFEFARTAYDNPGLTHRRFNGGVPDELAFQIALIQSGMEPHAEVFLPFYWEPIKRENLLLGAIKAKGYFGYSIGGAHLTPPQMAIYNNLAGTLARTMGIKHPFTAVSKRDYLKQRQII